MRKLFFFFVFLLLPSLAWAQNDVLIETGTTLAFIPQEGTEDADFDFDGLAAGSGYQSEMYDTGTADKAVDWGMFCATQFETNPVVGETVTFYLKLGDGTRYLNDDGATTGALSSTDKALNLKYIGQIIVDEVSQTAPMVMYTEFRTYARYVGLAVINNTADQVSTTTSEVGCYLTPYNIEIQ